MLLLTFVGGFVGAASWLMGRLVAAVVGGAGPGVAGGRLLLGVGFFPNLVAGASALSVGATLTGGARTALGGVERGPIDHLSLIDAGGPWYAWLLLVVPPLVCFVCGAAARRHLPIGAGAAGVLAAAGGTYALCMAALAALAGVRMWGAGGGEAGISADVVEVFVLALAWGAGLGAAGWIAGYRPVLRGELTPRRRLR